MPIKAPQLLLNESLCTACQSCRAEPFRWLGSIRHWPENYSFAMGWLKASGRAATHFSKGSRQPKQNWRSWRFVPAGQTSKLPKTDWSNSSPPACQTRFSAHERSTNGGSETD